VNGNRLTGLLTLVVAAIVVAALYFAQEVLIPFALAVVLSFLIGPIVARLQRWRVHRVAAVLLAMITILGATGLLGWFVAGEFREIAAMLPQYRQGISAKIESARRALEPSVNASKTVADIGAELTEDDAAPEATPVRVVDGPTDPVEVIRDVLSPTLDILFAAAMVLVFTFVMLLRRGDLRDRFIRLVGDGRIPVTTQALDEAAELVSRYLGRMLLVNSIYGAALAIGLWALDVPSALLWGVLATLLRFIPYLGPWIAAAFPILTVFATSEGWQDPLLVGGMIAVLELITNLVLEPWFYGNGTGISALALLLSTLFWTWLWGPVGLALSTPFTVCLVVMGKHVPQLRFLYLMFSDAPALPAPARLYQRLLTGEQDQSWEIVKAELAEHPLPAVYDAVVLPALLMSERDRMRGALDDEARERLAETLGLVLDVAGEAGREEGGAREAGPGLRALVLPGSDEADALSALMAAQVLEHEGLEVELVPLEELTGEILERIERSRPHVLLISVVPPSRLRHVHYLCKRLAADHPELPVVLGLWCRRPDGDSLADRSPAFEAVTVVSNLEEARETVRRAAEIVRSRHEQDELARTSRDASGEPVGRRRR
jgi:predicted PurR-regulated permease PerM